MPHPFDFSEVPPGTVVLPDDRQMPAAEFFRRYGYRLGQFRDAHLVVMNPGYEPSQEIKGAIKGIVVVIQALLAGLIFKSNPTLSRVVGAGTVGYVGADVTAWIIRAITTGKHIQIIRIGDFQQMMEGRK